MMWVPVTLYTSSVKTRLYGTILHPILNRIQQRPFRYQLSEATFREVVHQRRNVDPFVYHGVPTGGGYSNTKKKVKEKKEDGIY